MYQQLMAPLKETTGGSTNCTVNESYLQYQLELGTEINMSNVLPQV